jgi:hypothetical protein
MPELLLQKVDCMGSSWTSDVNDGDGLSLTVWMSRRRPRDSDVGGASQAQL